MALPTILAPGGPLWFPDPRHADAEGLVAIGGDLGTERLLLAYASGLFPWYDESAPVCWWSPDPRAILPHERLHIPRRLSRTLRQHQFRLTWNRAFAQVIRACGTREEGTWLLPEMIEAYQELHRLGHVHSLEVWRGDLLVGGLYGVQRGALFAAESMFHRATDMSKVALVAALHTLHRAGIQLFEVQFVTPHLAQFGTLAIPRREYLRRLALATSQAVDLSQLTPAVP